MPRFGGLCHYPNRFGGKGPSGVRLEGFVNSLNQARGDAYDTTATSNVYAENFAAARVINDIWSTQARFANQWDAARMTTNLPRWEKILGLSPFPSDSDATRRTRIATLFARTGQSPFTAYLATQLAALIGPVFVAVEYISYANARITSPDNTYPWGAVAPGAPWSSTTAHILVRTKLPASYREAEFQAAVGLIAPFMEASLPAWSTYDWYRPGNTSVNIPGGPSAGGFYLDDGLNLNFEVFDV